MVRGQEPGYVAVETQKEHSRLAKWVREVRNGTQAVNLERHFKIPCAGRRAQADTAMADPTMFYPAVTHSLRTTAEPEGWVSRQTNLPTGRNQCRSWGWGRQAFAQVRVSVENLHPLPQPMPSSRTSLCSAAWAAAPTGSHPTPLPWATLRSPPWSWH